MTNGIPVSRHCIITMKNHSILVDWGGELFQDIHTGDFLKCQETDISHTTLDGELELLRKAGLVAKYDEKQVFIISLPEPPKRTIE